MGTQWYAALQFGHHEVIKRTTLDIARPRQGKNVVPEPVHQQRNIVGQADGRIARVSGYIQSPAGTPYGLSLPPPKVLADRVPPADPSSRPTTCASRVFITHFLVVASRVELSEHDAAEGYQRSL